MVQTELPGIPEYRRIRDSLRAQVESGQITPGSRIPTERELVERFGVAHMTVRHAVDGLVREGLLARRRGSGTFVVRRRAANRPTNRLQSFSDDVGPERAGAKVISQRECIPSEDVADFLEIVGNGRVVELTRLRTIDGEAAAINEVWVPARRCPDLVNVSMENRSLYAYLEELGISLGSAEQRIFAVAATQHHADLLNIPVGSPQLCSERLTRDADNIPIEFARTWSRPDLGVWVEMKR